MDNFSHLASLCEDVFVNPRDHDCLIWKPSANGILSLKEAFSFFSRFHVRLWGSSLWNAAIPVSWSLLFWRLYHRKLPMDDNLLALDLYLPSVYNLYFKGIESLKHLFFDCAYAKQMWIWISKQLDINVVIQNMIDCTSAIDLAHSSQWHISNTVSCIRLARNSVRFQDRRTRWQVHCASILSASSLSGNLSLAKANSSISDFVVLKKFKVVIHLLDFRRLWRCFGCRLTLVG